MTGITDNEPDKGPYGSIIDQHRPDLTPFEETYRQIHQNPELSGQEAETAAIAANHLRTLPMFEVHTNIGGHGVAGVLRNGDGPTVLLRAETDALPIQEATGLPYASTKTMRDTDGVEKPVMHACGHDMHVAALLAAATLVHSMQAHWSGTLITLFQPAEERGSGAQSMLDDGLYDRIPRPHVVFAQHVSPMASGTLFALPGPCLAAFDAMTIQIYGRGGHAAFKDRCISPIVIGAEIVSRLETIGHDLPPGAEAIVACGSIHAGSAVNIIPDALEMKVSVRTFDPSIREKTVDAVRHIVESECVAAGVERRPRITFTERVPPTINDEALATGLSHTFAGYFGKDVVAGAKAPASEDFSFLATAVGAPYVMWSFGGTERRKYEDAVRDGTEEQLPANHSSLFAPVVESTLRVGVDALGLAVLMVLGK